MKQTIKMCMAACALAMSLVSCGTMGGASSSQSGTQDVLGSVLGTLLGNALPVSYETMAGTWTYSSPEVRFESESDLAKAGGLVAAAEVEKKLAETYAKVGIVPGACSFTFTTDKKCTLDLGGRQISGTYTIDSQSHAFTFKSSTGLLSLTGKAYFSGKSIALIFDAKKLLTITQALGAISGQGGSLGTLSSVLSQYDGLMLGMNLSK